MSCMGLTFDKLLVILVIALIVLGPERLPYYAQKLGELVKGMKRMADGAKERVKDEMGPEFDDIDWAQLDPRQYDPRRIIRDALREEGETPQARRARAAAAARARRQAGGTKAAPDGAAAMGIISTADDAAVTPGQPEIPTDAAIDDVRAATDEMSMSHRRTDLGFNYDEQAT